MSVKPAPLAERIIPGGDIVAHWPCVRCKQPTAVYEFAAECLAAFNRLLSERSEPRINTDKVIWCNPCRDLREQHYARLLSEKAENVKRAMIDLNGSSDPDNEHAALKVLRSYGYQPADIAEILTAIKKPKIQAKGRQP